MDVAWDGTKITLIPSAEELPTVVWMFARVDGSSLIKLTVEQFIKQRNDQLISEQKDSLFLDAVSSGVLSAPISKKVG